MNVLEAIAAEEERPTRQVHDAPAAPEKVFKRKLFEAVWIAPFLAAWFSSILTGGLAFLFTSNYSTHASVSGNQAQIIALQEREHAIESQLATYPITYVSQSSFAEFKSRYEKDQAEEHDFRVRVDSKIDILLAEHGPSLTGKVEAQ